MWHVTHDKWGEVNLLSKFELPSSYGLGVKVFWRYFHKGSLSQLISNEGAVCPGRSDLIHTSLISDLFPLRTSKESSLSSKSHPFRHKVFLFPEQPWQKKIKLYSGWGCKLWQQMFTCKNNSLVCVTPPGGVESPQFPTGPCMARS